jgi:hypothetical protein
MKLFLDDERTPWDDSWTLRSDYSSMLASVKEMLRSEAAWEVSLDNDLGEFKEGWQILQEIEAARFLSDDNVNLPVRICIHTANIAARRRMQSACRSLGYRLEGERKNSQCRGEVWKVK